MHITLSERLKVDDEEWKNKMNLTKREHIQHKFFKAIDSIVYHFAKAAKAVWDDNRATSIIGLREIMQAAISNYIDESIQASAILNPDNIDAKIAKPRLGLCTDLYEDSAAAVLTLAVEESDVLHWRRTITVPVEMCTAKVFKVRDVSGTEYVLRDPEKVTLDLAAGYFECRMADTGDILQVRFASILEGCNHRVIFNPEKNRNKTDTD